MVQRASQPPSGSRTPLRKSNRGLSASLEMLELVLTGRVSASLPLKSRLAVLRSTPELVDSGRARKDGASQQTIRGRDMVNTRSEPRLSTRSRLSQPPGLRAMSRSLTTRGVDPCDRTFPLHQRREDSLRRRLPYIQARSFPLQTQHVPPRHYPR